MELMVLRVFLMSVCAIIDIQRCCLPAIGYNWQFICLLLNFYLYLIPTVLPVIYMLLYYAGTIVIAISYKCTKEMPVEFNISTKHYAGLGLFVHVICADQNRNIYYSIE